MNQLQSLSQHFPFCAVRRLGVAEVPRWVFGMATLAKELVRKPFLVDFW